MSTTSRLTIDIPKEDHKNLKAACARMGKSIKDFAIENIHKGLEEYENHLLAKECEESYGAYKRGEEEVIGLEELKKELSNELQSRL